MIDHIFLTSVVVPLAGYAFGWWWRGKFERRVGK